LLLVVGEMVCTNANVVDICLVPRVHFFKQDGKYHV